MALTSLRFDEPVLVSKIDRLSARDRAAFAAASAERMLHAYAKFSSRTGRGDPSKLNRLLARLWNDLAGDTMPEQEVDALIHAADELVPNEDDRPWVPEQPAAEDAVSAVAYALRCRQNGSPQEAAWAARRAYEAIDNFVMNDDNVDPNVPGAEGRILSHPLIQAELGRQQRDLEDLLTGKATLQQLRERSMEEAAHFLTTMRGS